MALVGRGIRCSLWLTLLLLAGCAPWQPAPEQPSSSGSEPDRRSVQAPPLWYRVERGDTLYSIAFRYGLDWRAIARWNGIGAPYTIRPGQELRMSAPPPSTQRAPDERTSLKPASGGNTNHSKEPEPGPEQDGPSESRVDSSAAGSSTAPPASGKTRSVAGVAWQWPTDGRLARSFDPADTRKGVGLAGNLGQDVVAAAAGQVVYSGTALIGYGELIIIKHSDELLSAYGHNRRRLVGEGDRVQRGQKIAEMGRDDRREEMLHFEIRRDGEPVNPLDYLPKINQQ